MDNTDTESWSYPGSWLQQLYFLPGDYLLARLVSGLPTLAAWLDIGPGDYGGGLSAVISLFVWAALLLGIRQARYSMRVALSAVLTSMSTVRLAVQTRLFVAKRAWQQIVSRLRREPAMVVTGIDLDPLDEAILAIEAHLEPGFSMTAPDFAEELGVRPAQAQRSLDKLKAYQLVAESFGSMDGYDGYQITQSGRFVVTANGLERESVH